jgi:hypothetical protein
VIVGWPFIGIIAETYGFLKLFGYSMCGRVARLCSGIYRMEAVATMYMFFLFFFPPLRSHLHSLRVDCVSLYSSGFLPYVIMSLRQIPLFGYLLRLPGLSHVCSHRREKIVSCSCGWTRSRFVWCVFFT